MTISKHTLQNRIYITMTNECLNLFSRLLGFGHGLGFNLSACLGVFHPAPLVTTGNKALYNASTC